jgi:hypothetical protein
MWISYTFTWNTWDIEAAFDAAAVLFQESVDGWPGNITRKDEH